MRTDRNALLSAYALAVYVFLFLPIVILIIFSFNADRRNFNWAGFTLDWYPTLFSNKLILGALGVTLQVAAIAVFASVGARDAPGARPGATRAALARSDGGAPAPADGDAGDRDGDQPAAVLRDAVRRPGVVHPDLDRPHHVLHVVRGDHRPGASIGLDPHLEEAGRDLGASAWGAFRHVTMPLLAPAIAAGGMIAFALSFDDLVITSFNAGVGSSTLPLYIYSKIRFGVTPEINAVSTIIVGRDGRGDPHRLAARRVHARTTQGGHRGRRGAGLSRAVRRRVAVSAPGPGRDARRERGKAATALDRRRRRRRALRRRDVVAPRTVRRLISPSPA